MKAAIYTKYGPPDVLQIGEVPKPVPADDQVLIRMHAAALNPYDWHFLRGTPYPVRLIAGVGKPKFTGLGYDGAGEVEAVGKSVKRFQPGDAVFGGCKGAFAEFACAAESALTKKPERATFEEAACAPMASFTALQALRDKGHLRAGQSVLVNGAGGGVGTFGVQIAKAFGGQVTGVCSARNLETVRSIGADRVIDYAQEDFTRSADRYDIILDCVGNRSFAVCRRVLKPQGIYVGAGGTTDNWMLGPLTRALSAWMLSWFVSQKSVGVLAKASAADLDMVCEWIAAGEIRPVIGRRYKLSEIAEAIRYLEEGHAQGKVVIQLT